MMSAPKEEKVFKALREQLHKAACNTEPIYYYVLLKDFSEYITADILTELRNEYIKNIDKSLPDFLL